MKKFAVVFSTYGMGVDEFAYVRGDKYAVRVFSSKEEASAMAKTLTEVHGARSVGVVDASELQGLTVAA